MKYYGYSGKKSQSRFKANRKRLIFNIAIIAATVVLSVAFALILGNHLKNKLDGADVSVETTDEFFTPIEIKDPDPADAIDPVKNNRAEGEMSAIYGYLDLAGCPDEGTAQKFVYNLKSIGYGGFIFNVRGAAGKYAYASNAASELTGTALPSGVIPSAHLAGALYTAREQGMRSAAYIELGDAASKSEEASVQFAIDRAVIRELSEMGFSEIVLGGAAQRDDLTTEFAVELYDVISSIRRDCDGTDFGLVISPSVLDDPENTPALELIFRYIDFFALDLRDSETYTPEAISAMIEKYSGSFSAYSILVIADGSGVGGIRSVVAAVGGQKNPNVAFATQRADYKKNNDGKVPYSSKLEKYSLKEIKETKTGDKDGGNE